MTIQSIRQFLKTFLIIYFCHESLNFWKLIRSSVNFIYSEHKLFLYHPPKSFERKISPWKLSFKLFSQKSDFSKCIANKNRKLTRIAVRVLKDPPPPPSLRFLLYEGGGDVHETIETRARRRHKRARIITFASLVALQLPFFQAWSAFPFSPVTVIPGHILLLLYHYSLAAPPFFLLLQSGLKKKKNLAFPASDDPGYPCISSGKGVSCLKFGTFCV